MLAQAIWYSAEEPDTLVEPTKTRLRSIHSKQVCCASPARPTCRLQYPSLVLVLLVLSAMPCCPLPSSLFYVWALIVAIALVLADVPVQQRSALRNH
jgi:hypothetical protein